MSDVQAGPSRLNSGSGTRRVIPSRANMQAKVQPQRTRLDAFNLRQLEVSQEEYYNDQTLLSWIQDNPVETMPERPPFPGRPAQPPGPTFLQYSPDGQRLIVAGVGNFARSFRTGDNGEPDLLPETHEETYAVASGVRFYSQRQQEITC